MMLTICELLLVIFHFAY